MGVWEYQIHPLTVAEPPPVAGDVRLPAGR